MSSASSLTIEHRFWRQPLSEVESGAAAGGEGDSRDVRKLTKQVDKMASSLRKKMGRSTSSQMISSS